MIDRVEAGKKYRLIDKESYVTGHNNAYFNYRLLTDKDIFDENMCVVIQYVDKGYGKVDRKAVISPNEYHMFELVEEYADRAQSQITSLYTVGRVLKPYGDHIGYSIIVHMSDSHATLLTEFGNFVEVTINELHGFQIVGLFVGPTGVCAFPPQNPLDRLKDQMDNLNHAKKVLFELGFA